MRCPAQNNGIFFDALKINTTFHIHCTAETEDLSEGFQVIKKLWTCCAFAHTDNEFRVQKHG